MAEVSSKDPVSLEDLKRAIAEVGYAPSGSDPWDSHALYQRARADAWRTAFKWRDRIHRRYRAVDVFSNAWEVVDKEHSEGMTLIGEKLT